MPVQTPTHIFKVMASVDSVPERKFRNHQESFSTAFAYHGSKVESFYSILNYGLQQHLCKVKTIDKMLFEKFDHF